ncbi:GRF1-interacting factor 2 isoform X1 [Beta vulgaris subsp. vulgaris]|uniref:GRF1-interacting factor 2 isoform X1 n=1 Tax=Beta vulgaris subsp. vulgaris TaxID=3555 RepID=UPI0020375A26|nr:GRF1-interacting factor 2 isoform X1 [Beta vulgaris subsp. vulgaris]
MQQQSPQMFNHPPSQPTITTEQIQKYLDENKQLILAIMESQNSGKMNECAQYQAQLQKNLMYLAAIADAQPPAPTGPSQPQNSQMPMQSTIPQGPFMPPPKPANTPQQTGPRLPFALQSFDQQSPHMQMQYQQSMAGSMGMRMGGNNVLRPSIQTGYGAPTHFMDARNRQDGSEASLGDDHGK